MIANDATITPLITTLKKEETANKRNIIGWR